MTIPTQMSLHGYIATAPELSFTDKGHARFYCRVGIEQHRKEVDGSFTRLDPVYADLVSKPAEERALTQTLFEWLPVGGFQVDVGFLADPLSMQRADG